MFDASKPSVFFSHSSLDSVLVAHVAEAAQSADLNLYLAEHESTPGARIADKVLTRLEQSWAVLVLITANSAHNVWINQEIGMGVSGRKLVVPIVTPDATNEDFGALTGVEYFRIDPDDPLGSVSQVIVALKAQDAANRAAHTALAIRQERIDLLKLAALMVALGLVIAAGTNGS